MRSQREGGLLRPPSPPNPASPRDASCWACQSLYPAAQTQGWLLVPGASSRRRRWVRHLCSPPGGSAVFCMWFKGVEKRTKSKEEHDSEISWTRCGRNVHDPHQNSISTDESVHGKGEGAQEPFLKGRSAWSLAGCAGRACSLHLPCPGRRPVPRGQGPSPAARAGRLLVGRPGAFAFSSGEEEGRRLERGTLLLTVTC